jgi:sugar phosphate isomerase/epimerase
MRLVLSGTEIPPGDGAAPLAAAAADLGVGWVEFWYPRNSSRLGLAASLACLAEAGIRVACVGTATELGTQRDAPAAQETLIDAVRIAADIGAGLVNTYFGWPPVLDDARSAQTYLRNLRPCLRAAEQAGVVLVLENEFDGFGRDQLGADLTRRPDSLAALMAAVDSPHFRLTFDPCNAYFAGLDPAAMYDVVAPYVGYVHLKDGDDRPPAPGWRRFTDHGRSYATCPLGQGQVGWPGLLARLRRDGYQGFLSSEPHCEQANLGPAWRQAASYVREAP